jgi:DNA-binding response OmpR family regulator
MRILIAEDSDDLRQMLTFALESEGWEVFPAKDGLDALRIYHNMVGNNSYFDVLLLDVEMPRLKGYAVGVNIRNVEKFGDVPRAKHIYFTGHDDVVPPEQLLETEFADGYIHKPVDTKELIEQINELVKDAGD